MVDLTSFPLVCAQVFELLDEEAKEPIGVVELVHRHDPKVCLFTLLDILLP
jgi:hypothetical protein